MPNVSTIREFLCQQRNGARVLIVDDEPAICEVVAMALQDCGVQTETVGTAEEACDLLAANRFQLLVTDKNLPLMSGLELLARAAEVAPEMPAVVITGYASVDTVKQALDLGAIDYITKPFDDIYVVATKLAEIVSRRICLNTYEQIASALFTKIQSRDHDGVLANRISVKLGTFKRQLATAPNVIIFDHEGVAARIGAAFTDAGFRTLLAASAADVLRQLGDNPTVSVAIIASDHPQSMELLTSIQGRRHMHFVLSSTEPQLQSTLGGLALGASDLYLRDHEDPETLVTRLRHKIKTSQREQLYARLFGTLYVHSDLVHQDLIELIDELAPDAKRAIPHRDDDNKGYSATDGTDASAVLRELSPQV